MVTAVPERTASTDSRSQARHRSLQAQNRMSKVVQASIDNPCIGCRPRSSVGRKARSGRGSATARSGARETVAMGSASSEPTRSAPTLRVSSSCREAHLVLKSSLAPYSISLALNLLLQPNLRLSHDVQQARAGPSARFVHQIFVALIIHW
jgi:hypothetical protein